MTSRPGYRGDEFPLILGVRTNNDWFAGLNRSLERFDPEHRERISWWERIFTLSYTEYRGRLAAIARRNWARIEGLDSIVNLVTREPESLGGELLLPIDDDDWLHPEIVRILRARYRPETTSLSWMVHRTDSPRRYVHPRHGTPARFATNGYLLTPEYRRRTGREIFRQAAFWHLAASRHAPPGNIHLERVLGVAPRNWASLTTLRRFRDLEEFRRAVRLAATWIDREFPVEETYAEEYGALFQLDRELIRGANC
jgi:hypothetical protein